MQDTIEGEENVLFHKGKKSDCFTDYSDPSYLTVKAVVDSVNNVVSLRGCGCESALVLLDHVLLRSGKSWDIVQITDRLVRSVGCDLSCNSGVKTGHLKVDTNVGVVDVDDASSTQKTKTFVVTNGVGGRCEGGKSGNGCCLGQEFAALCGELSGRSLNVVGRCEGGNRSGETRERELITTDNGERVRSIRSVMLRRDFILQYDPCSTK